MTSPPSEGNYGPWTTLDALRKGAIFETQDGIRAVKSEYWYSTGGAPQCVLLASGEYAHFALKRKEPVREIMLERNRTCDGCKRPIGPCQKFMGISIELDQEPESEQVGERVYRRRRHRDMPPSGEIDLCVDCMQKPITLEPFLRQPIEDDGDE